MYAYSNPHVRISGLARTKQKNTNVAGKVDQRDVKLMELQLFMFCLKTYIFLGENKSPQRQTGPRRRPLMLARIQTHSCQHANEPLMGPKL